MVGFGRVRPSTPCGIGVSNRSALLSLSKPSSLGNSSVFRLSTSKLEWSGEKNSETLLEGSCSRIQAVTNEGWKVRLMRNEAVFSGTNRITMSMAEGGDRLWALERDVGSLAGPGCLQVASYLDKTLTKRGESMCPRPNSLLSEKGVRSTVDDE